MFLDSPVTLSKRERPKIPVNRFSEQLFKWISAKFGKEELKIHSGQSKIPWKLYLKTLVPYFTSDYEVSNFRRETLSGILQELRIKFNILCL